MNLKFNVRIFQTPSEYPAVFGSTVLFMYSVVQVRYASAGGVKRLIHVKHLLFKPILKSFIYLFIFSFAMHQIRRELVEQKAKVKTAGFMLYRRNICVNICSPMNTVLQQDYQRYSLYTSVLWEYTVMQFKIHKWYNFLYPQAQCFLCFSAVFFIFNGSGTSPLADSYSTAFKTTSPPPSVGIWCSGLRLGAC